MAKPLSSKPSYVLKEFDKPLYIAAHFGFLPIEAPKITDKDRNLVKDCEETENKNPTCLYRPAEKVAFLRTYLEKNLSGEPHPLLLSYKKNETSKKKADYYFHIVGLSTALSEAMLIRTSISVLSDEGHKNLVVNINSVGDKDSLAAYERELHQYAKKVANELTPEMKIAIKKDIFSLVKDNQTEKVGVREEVPSSIASLSASGRAHFKEVLEHLEALGVEFRVMPQLVGNRNYSSHTIFTICDATIENAPPLASGYRYSRLSKRFGLRKEIPCSAAIIFGDLKKDNAPKKIYKELPKPKFYLVQLGNDAKLKSLTLIEHLRFHHIPVYHYIGRDKITAQLGTAENLKVPYLLIMGQKEALENSVTVRNMSTRAQHTVKVSELPEYLKHIHL